jgi:hypothetical protein
VWLWALAHDLHADDRFKRRALAARLPMRPLMRALALLRLHQLTGDIQLVAHARRVLARAPRVRFHAADTALAAAELMAPELAVPPPFACPISVARFPG